MYFGIDIANNTGTFFGNDIVTYPKNLIMNYENKNYSSGEAILENLGPGQKLTEVIRFILTDENMTEIRNWPESGIKATVSV